MRLKILFTDEEIVIGDSIGHILVGPEAELESINKGSCSRGSSDSGSSIYSQVLRCNLDSCIVLACESNLKSF